METAGISKHTISFGLAAALASVVNAVLVVVKEKSPAVEAGLQKLTGNHWISHAAIVFSLFAVFGWLSARANRGQGPKMSASRLIVTIVAGVVTGGVIIVGFYLIGD